MTSVQALDPTSPCHKLSHLLGPLERDVLYGRPLFRLFMREKLAKNVGVKGENVTILGEKTNV